MVHMKALKGFSNTRIENGGKRGDGSVLIGEDFSTDWLHAKELATGGLAEAKNAADLDNEPTDDVPASHTLSVAEHATIIARRTKKLDAATKPAATV